MRPEITWLSIFADVPAAQYAIACAFWQEVTATTAGAPAGDDREFTPLVPAADDGFFWLQRVHRDDGGWHPDLHVRNVAEAARHAVDHGARPVQETADLVVLETPAGQPFCLVRDGRAQPRQRPPTPEWGSGRSLADQLCLDIPAGEYDADAAFWAELTGWSPAETNAPEFRRLSPPGGQPVQFLLQRLGAEDAVGPRAHLDMAADDADAEVLRHHALGATTVGARAGWTTLHDPVGLTYCVTRRRPGDHGSQIDRADAWVAP